MEIEKIIKPLIWQTRQEDQVVHADPQGMKWSYYIEPQSDKNVGKYQLALIDDHGKFDEWDTSFENLEDAKLVAFEHYKKQILANLTVTL